jgi:5-formyltetrahydrofolate cyclo-ligase
MKMESLTSNSKSLLRRHLRCKRQQLSFQRRQEASSQCYTGLKPFMADCRFVLSFASFKDELDLWNLNAFLAWQGKLVLPKVEKESLCLFHVQNLQTDLTFNQWNILEPLSSCKEIAPRNLSLALIPGLGFDQTTGHRLGYGMGFYDRFLIELPPTIQTLGIGFKEQAIKGLPIDAHDVPLTDHYLF